MMKEQNTPKARLDKHMQIFAQKIKECTRPGLTEEEIQLKAVEEANKLAPLTEVEFKLMQTIQQMTDRQRVAYLNPVTTPGQFLNRGYNKVLFKKDLLFSTSVTLPDMEGQTSWHASVALLDATKRPRSLSSVPERHRVEALNLLKSLLDGVGVGPGEMLEAGASLQLIKQLSSVELEGLKAEQSS